jgi:tRNA nucleotidyltransferase/poly(A) polymerase
METYLVGGAVRDELLGLPIKEKDWVVVGETPESMKKLGFTQVGKEFPVFLHPISREEYALARKERKTSPGHRGFSCQFSPEVTLEEDLSRRDLTINAMAKKNDQYIDPFHGKKDLNNRILRHVSPAFSEDPLRVLRVARLLAQLSAFNFTIAPETLSLMKQQVTRGDLAELSQERVWGEISKALATQNPERFFLCLQSIHALPILTSDPWVFPSKPLPFHFSLPQRFAWFFHPYIDHLGFTPPHNFYDFTRLIHSTFAEYRIEKDPSGLATLLSRLDCLRRKERFHEWLDFFAEWTGDPQPRDFLTHAACALKKINFESITQSHQQDPRRIKEAIYQAKINALIAFLR